MFDVTSAKQKISNFISETYLFNSSDQNLIECDSFLEQGIIDSTGILELISFLQDSFSISINDSEILPENFDSVSNILSFLTKKGIISN